MPHDTAAASVARRVSRRLAQYVSWQRAVAVEEVFFARLDAKRGQSRTVSPLRERIHTEGGCCPRAQGTMLRPDATFAVVWGVYITVLTLTYVALLVPVLTAFDAPLRVSGPPWRWSAWVDFVGGLSFLVDIPVTFNTGVVVSSKVLGRRTLVMDPADVARVYLRGTFPYDLLAVVPFFVQCVLSLFPYVDPKSAVSNASSSVTRTAVHALRLLRLLRLARLRKHLFGATVGNTEAVLSRETDLSPLALYSLQTLYEFSVMINSCASVFIYAATVQGYADSWLKNVDDLEPALALDSRVYVSALYFATATVTTVGFGDLSATTHLERVLTTLCMAAGATYFAYLVGSIANIIEKYGTAASRRAAYREKMVELHSFLNRHSVPHHLRAQMVTYFSDVWVRRHRHMDDAVMLRELPEDLRREVTFHILEPTLRQVFRGARERSLRALASRLTKRTVLRGTSMLYDLDGCCSGAGAGDTSEGAGTFFIVLEGKFIVTTTTSDVPVAQSPPEAVDVAEREYRVVGTVQGGNSFSYFGADALLTGLDPIGAAKLRCDAQCVRDKEVYEAILGAQRVTALSMADIFEIPPAAAAHLIVTEHPDLLSALVTNAQQELYRQEKLHRHAVQAEWATWPIEDKATGVEIDEVNEVGDALEDALGVLRRSFWVVSTLARMFEAAPI